MDGWVNLDRLPAPGVDTVADLNDCADTPLPFPDDSFDEFLGSHVLEHIQHALPLMQELHRVARAGARAVFHLPYGSSDDACEDPTHVRRYFIGSFSYFSQPCYWRADYGYRGDWRTEAIVLRVPQERYRGWSLEKILEEVMHLRNVVRDMSAVLVAVKPIREPRQELQTPPPVHFEMV